MKYVGFLLGSTILIAAGCSGGSSEPEGGSPSTGTPSTTAAATGFASVQPIFAAKCASCHGDQTPKAGLSLTSYANVMKGAGAGPAVVAGDPAGSLILKAVKGEGAKKMPPGPTGLEAGDIAKLEAWIKDGAKE